MCIDHYEYSKGPSRLTTLSRNTGTKDLSFDSYASVNQNPRMRPGYDPRFPNRQDDTEVMMQAQKIPRVSSSMEWEMYSRYDERDRDQGYQYDRRSDADRVYGGYTGRVTESDFQWRDIWNDNYLTMNANERTRRGAKERGFSSNDPYADGTRLHWR